MSSTTPGRWTHGKLPSVIRRLPALAWALFVGLCALWLIYRIPTASIESSIFALLPEREEDPAVREAGAGLRAELERHFLVLFSAEDHARAVAAAEAYAASLRISHHVKELVC